MIVEILGKGCPKCMALEKNVKNALMDLNKEAEIKHIKDINKIAEYGVMITPALAIDGKVKSSGKVLSPKEIKEYLRF